jgi:hypothetical protein
VMHFGGVEGHVNLALGGSAGVGTHNESCYINHWSLGCYDL